MNDDDEICTACGEPRSAHVATDKGPLTHPKEARGEGFYNRSSGTSHHGLSCLECIGPCDGHEWESWSFVPARQPWKGKPPTSGEAPMKRPRKPETLPPVEHLDMAENYLQLAARHIDTAGDIAGTDRADMLACYASNLLHGSLSLIRELRQALEAPAAPPPVKR